LTAWRLFGMSRYLLCAKWKVYLRIRKKRIVPSSEKFSPTSWEVLTSTSSSLMWFLPLGALPKFLISFSFLSCILHTFPSQPAWVNNTKFIRRYKHVARMGDKRLTLLITVRNLPVIWRCESSWLIVEL
jgi:hypothetical protein